MTVKPHIIELQKVDSTNSYAASLIRSKKVEEETVISTIEQTSGKGQGENRWESEPGKTLPSAGSFSLTFWRLKSSSS